MWGDDIIIPTNPYQTPVTREFMQSMPQRVQDQFMEFVGSIPLLKWMMRPDRPRACDLPRDDKGRVLVDIVRPHILEDTDYFRPSALYYEENGCYTSLRPNPNPNSEFGKWFREEVRRCRDGYVRESDGEWVTGLEYFYLNYSPIMLNRKSESSDVFLRVEGFPLFWEGIHYRYAYWDQARASGTHCLELSRRGSSKSFSLASAMTRNLLLGESSEACRRVSTVLSAYLSEYLSDKDGTFSKFTPMVDFLSGATEFPRLKYINRPSDMVWAMGYKNRNGNIQGSRNSVMGLSVKDNEGKIRGKRGFIFFEEFGSYPNFKEVWNNVRDSVKSGSHTFSLLVGVGTAGDKASDFAGLRNMLYNPRSYGVLDLENVYDLKGKGKDRCAYFFPSYISYEGFIDRDGNSDVTGALRKILMERYEVEQSSDPATLLNRTANMPVTPEEAILKVKSTFFPTVALQDRKREIEQDPRFFDRIYVGTLVNVKGKVEFRSTDDKPIREWPVEEAREGALEIYEMPPEGPITSGRYILGVDPIENDKAQSESLFCAIMFDLFTDRIVAQYIGRMQRNEWNMELAYKMCRFWNAKCCPEANKKIFYAYFARKHALWMLVDCPEYLKQRNIIKYDTFGSSSKGVQATPAVISAALDMINDWLTKTVVTETADGDGELHTEETPMLQTIDSVELLDELIGYSPEKNTDAVSALMQVMLYREQFIILYGDSPHEEGPADKEEDDFFGRDWDRYSKGHAVTSPFSMPSAKRSG